MFLTATTMAMLAQANEIAGVRREARPTFAIDTAFQADGGVQIFFDLVLADQRPDENANVAMFRAALEADGRWKQLDEPTHLTMARISYTLDKDVSFFSRDRIFDLSYVRSVAPDMKIGALPDGRFSVARSPAHTFSLTYLQGSPNQTATALAGHDGSPVVIQRNEGFARVAAWRTAAYAMTWTFHESLGPGKTRLTVLTMSALYNLPPFFMGAGNRLYSEMVEHTVSLIGRLRRFPVETSLSQR
jgi:hypothetical protein